MAGPGDSYAKETRAYNPQFADENPEEEYDAKLEEVRGVLLPRQSRALFISTASYFFCLLPRVGSRFGLRVISWKRWSDPPSVTSVTFCPQIYFLVEGMWSRSGRVSNGHVRC